MIGPAERVSDATLKELQTLDDSSLSSAVFHSIVRELLERRRGEYICPKCCLRIEPEPGTAPYFPF